MVVLTDIFVFKEEGLHEGKVMGKMQPTGIRPKFSTRLQAAGFPLQPEMFMSESPLSPTGE